MYTISSGFWAAYEASLLSIIFIPLNDSSKLIRASEGPIDPFKMMLGEGLKLQLVSLRGLVMSVPSIT